MRARLAIGFGATSFACADDVVALVRATLATLAIPQAHPTDVADTVLATIDRRADLARDVGRLLDRPFVLFDVATLARVAQDARLTTTSPRALEDVGTPSVAEASALAALDGRGRLVSPRGTGRNCTCAIAETT